VIGFKFNGIHSSAFDIGAHSVQRGVMPERRRQEFTILGRSGTLELESQEFEKRTLVVSLGLMHTETFEDLRHKVRQIAGWLRGSGLLIFDDEPDKGYQATIYTAVGIEQLELQPKGVVEVEFECQPFAVSTETHKHVVTGSGKVATTIMNKGNVASCGTIVIKNTGNEAITDVFITRKAVEK
jgi:predicted phage tail component-like protein